MQAICTRIRQARERQGWSQTDLGARLPKPVSHATVSYIEQGHQRLHLDLLLDLAHTLDVPLGWLLEPVLDA